MYNKNIPSFKLIVISMLSMQFLPSSVAHAAAESKQSLPPSSTERVFLFGDSQLDVGNITRKIDINSAINVSVDPGPGNGAPFTQGDGNFIEQIFGKKFQNVNKGQLDASIPGYYSGTWDLKIRSVPDPAEAAKYTHVNLAQGGAKFGEVFPDSESKLKILLGAAYDYMPASLINAALASKTKYIDTISSQVDVFKKKYNNFKPDDLAIVMAGGNDVLAQGFDMAVPLNKARGELQAARHKLIDDIGYLGAKNIMLGTLPDLRVTPYLLNWKEGEEHMLHHGKARSTQDATERMHKLATWANEYTTSTTLNVAKKYTDLNITQIDLFKLIRHISESRDRYGLDHDLSKDCNSSAICSGATNTADVRYLTQDGLHPSAKTSKIIADAYRNFLNDAGLSYRARLHGPVKYDAFRDALVNITTKSDQNEERYHWVNGGVLDLSFQSQADALSSRALLHQGVIYVDHAVENPNESPLTKLLKSDLYVGDGPLGGAIDVAALGSQLEYSGNAYGGTLVKSGDGDLLLTGSSTLKKMIINAGSLSIGDGGNRGWLTGDLKNESHVTFNRADDKIFSGRIDGTGSILKDGKGTLMLTGTGDLSGEATVKNGALVVAGDFRYANVRILNGANLSGGGKIGSLKLEQGSIFAPNPNHRGALYVANNVTFDRGSFFFLDLAESNGNDPLRAGGFVDIKGGTVVALADEYGRDVLKRYKVLSANEGVRGRFDELVATDLIFLRPALSYDSHQVWLQMVRNERKPVEFCRGGNAKAACGALLPEPNPGAPIALSKSLARNSLLQAETLEILGMNEPQLMQLSTGLAGDVHPSLQQSLFQEASGLVDTVTGRMHAMSGEYARAGAWGQLFDSDGRREAHSDVAHLNTNSKGFLLGYDRWSANDDVMYGLFAGHRSTSISHGTSNANANTYDLGVYGTKQYNNVSLRLGASGSWHDLQIKRNINIKSRTTTFRADYGAVTAQIFSEAAVDLDFKALNIEPYIGLSYTKQNVQGFSENHALFALSGKRESREIHAARTGVRVNYEAVLDNEMRLDFQGGVGMKHLLSGIDTSTDMNFRSHPKSFSIAGVTEKRNILQLNTQVGMQLTRDFSIDLNYQTERAGGMNNQTFSASASWAF